MGNRLFLPVCLKHLPDAVPLYLTMPERKKETDLPSSSSQTDKAAVLCIKIPRPASKNVPDLKRNTAESRRTGFFVSL